MKKLITVLLIVPIAILAFFAFNKPVKSLDKTSLTAGDTLQYPDEKHFRNLQQLTFGGDNAELMKK